jgi:hypothetical protein
VELGEQEMAGTHVGCAVRERFGQRGVEYFLAAGPTGPDGRRRHRPAVADAVLDLPTQAVQVDPEPAERLD